MPFKITPVPAAIVTPQQVPAPPHGVNIVRSNKTGDLLPEGSEDVPSKDPEIKFPQPADGVDHKPFKNLK